MSVNEYGGSVDQGGRPAFFGLETIQATITTGPTDIITSVEGNRVQVTIHNHTTNVDVYISAETDVATTNGFGLHGGEMVQWDYCGPLYGIVSSGTAGISVASLKK